MMIKKMKSGTRNCILFASICAFLFCQANLAFALEQEEELLADSVPLASLDDTANSGSTAGSDVLTVEIPTISEAEGSPFDFILDPQSLIYDTNAALYGGGTVEKDAHLLFRNQKNDSNRYDFSSMSEMLSITNHGDAPMDVLISAKIENLGEMKLVQERDFQDRADCSFYLALTDSEGNLAPLASDGTAELRVSMSRAKESATDETPAANGAASLPEDAEAAESLLQDLASAIRETLPDADAEQLITAYLAETHLDNPAEDGNAADPALDSAQQAGQAASASDGIAKEADRHKYSFGLTGECNPNGVWDNIRVHPVITVSWTIETQKDTEEKAASDGVAKSDGTASDGTAKSDGTASDGVAQSDGTASDGTISAAASDGTSAEDSSAGSDGTAEENTNYSVTAAQESSIENDGSETSTSSKGGGSGSSGGGGSGGKTSDSGRDRSDGEDEEEEDADTASDGVASDGVAPDAEDTIDSSKSDGTADAGGTEDEAGGGGESALDPVDPEEGTSPADPDGVPASENEETSPEEDETGADAENGTGDAEAETETEEDARAHVSTPSNIVADS